jgi:hypothetical protein
MYGGKSSKLELMKQNTWEEISMSSSNQKVKAVHKGSKSYITEKLS